MIFKGAELIDLMEENSGYGGWSIQAIPPVFVRIKPDGFSRLHVVSKSLLCEQPRHRSLNKTTSQFINEVLAPRDSPIVPLAPHRYL
jgi:hypothetical protein